VRTHFNERISIFSTEETTQWWLHLSKHDCPSKEKNKQKRLSVNRKYNVHKFSMYLTT
jgi:hypothetical protein